MTPPPDRIHPTLELASTTEAPPEERQHSLRWYTSPDLRDDAWDSFLESIPRGHFQQSSRWAQVKSIEGWQPIRHLLCHEGRIVGGFQLLSRRTRFGHIGYISKGPVLAHETPALIESALDAIKSTTRAHGLRALIVQAPDSSAIDGPTLAAHGFSENHLINIVRATLLVDLRAGMEPVEQHIRRSTWSEIRKARKRGIIIREAVEADVPAFFPLMLATCQRQGSSPSPSTPDGVAAIWRAFQPNKVRLTFAEFEGVPLAGSLCLCFGSRVTFWKKGWSGAHRDRHPHQLLQHEAVEWSCKNGFEHFDFAALRPDIARTLLKREPLTEDQMKARDFVNLSHGNCPVLLPEDRVYIPNPVLGNAYRLGMAFPAARRLAARWIRV